MSKYYGVGRLMFFKDAFEVSESSPWKIPITWPDGEPEAFLPVFKTREAAVEYTDDGKYKIMELETSVDE
jgi:hypothetical protein